MSSIWELIAERETAATAAVEQLREQISKLSADLALAEAELADLAITRATLTRLTGPAQTTAPPDATVAYQQILAVFDTAAGMRAKDVCLALGLGVTAKDTGGLRANSGASSPAISSTRPSRDCSRSPQRRPHSLTSRTPTRSLNP